jgi:Holin of 3TMs, for gene-transfer release
MNIFSLFSGVVKPVFDGIFKWKSEQNKMEISRQDFELMRKKLESDIELRLAEEMRKPESEFRDFMLKFEGSAAEQTPFMRGLRSSVRPVITYWSLIIITLIMFGPLDGADLEKNLSSIPDPLWQIFLAVFGFWFGGRAAMQVAEKWKEGDVKKQEAESRGRVAEEKAKVERSNAELERAYAEKKPNKSVAAIEDDDDEFWGD